MSTRRCGNSPRGRDFPREAMKWALEHWETASPRFVSKLRAFAAGRDRSEAAERRSLHHRPPLRREGRGAGVRAAVPHDRRGSGHRRLARRRRQTETLPGILIKVFDGDLEPLKRAIESPQRRRIRAPRRCTRSAISSARRGVLSEEDMRAYLRRLRREAKPRDESVFLDDLGGDGGRLSATRICESTSPF